MRLEKYLTEKFAGADMTTNGLSEIFRNPDNKEMKELKDKQPRGYRFIIDAKDRAIYITDGEMLHDAIVDSIQPQLDLNYKNFYSHGDGMERFILGTTVGNSFDYIVSDSYEYMRRLNNDTLVEILSNLEELATYKFDWISRWVNPNKVIKLIDDAIKYIKGRV